MNENERRHAFWSAAAKKGWATRRMNEGDARAMADVPLDDRGTKRDERLVRQAYLARPTAWAHLLAADTI